MRHRGLTVITPILADQLNALRAHLNGIGKDIGGQTEIPFEELETVHFMRWVIIPEESLDGRVLPAQLILSTNYDGPESVHLHELVDKASAGLRRIYACCEGFPESSDDKSLFRFLVAHRRKYAAFYSGTAGRSVSQIREEKALRDEIQDYLQESNPSQDWSGIAPEDIRADILNSIRKQQTYKRLEKRYRDTFYQRFGLYLLGAGVLFFLAILVQGFIFNPLLAGGVLTGLIGFVLWFFISLNRHEKADALAYEPPPRRTAKISQLTSREDYKIQNQISHLVTVKPGFFRKFTLRFMLWAINLLARTFFNRGNLGGIPSIHFARWVSVDNGERLLFFSNYDGSWESYLGDFVDRAAVGLTGVWTNTEGFPPTRKLIFGGARRPADFKSWAREKQIETQVWYSAYKTISVANINTNTRIRKGLTGSMPAATWLQQL